MKNSIFYEEILDKNLLISCKYSFSRNGYIKKDGRKSIVLQYYINGKYLEMKTGMYLKAEKFVDLSAEEKITLEKMEYDGKLAIYKAMQNGTPYKNLKSLKYALLHKTFKNANFIEYGYEWINNSNKALGTKQNYKSILKSVEEFDKNLKITDFTFEKGMELIEYFKNQSLSKNAIAGKISSIKTILSAAEKDINIEKSTFHNIEIKGDKTEKRTHIDMKNLQKIENKIFKLKKLEKVRDIFLLSVYSGLRFSDITTLKNDEIQKGWIEKKTQKTGACVSIPVGDLFDGKFLKIVEKYGSIENIVKNIGENGAFNQKLKDVFKFCNLEEESNKNRWTFHTARHTFATLLLEQGMNPISIQKMLGHSKIGTTMNVYADITKNVIKNDLKNIKKQK